jgi:hypothetical protein
VIVTAVPPVVRPLAGVNDVIVGAGGTNVNWLDAVAVPPAVVTDTFTGPAASAGVVTVIDVAESAVTVPAVEPKSTAVALARFVPVIVTAVPPVVRPLAGVNDVIVGAGGTNVKFVVDVAVPPGVVTLIGTPPAASAGLVTVIEVAESAVTVPATVPKSTTDAAVRFVPVIVTAVPPADGPEVGVNDVIVGGDCENVYCVEAVALPPGVVTVRFTEPALSAGVVTVIDVAVSAVTVPAVEPKSTAEALSRPVPVMVTAVPPLIVPLVGVYDVIVGAGTANVNCVEAVAVPPPVVTLTLTEPAASAGVVTVIDEAVSAVTVPAVVPKSTAVAPDRFVPVIVTAVPP